MQRHDADDYAGAAVGAGAALAFFSVTERGEGYELLIDARDGRPAFRCRRCTLVSHHPGDIENLYCGFCHVFYERDRCP